MATTMIESLLIVQEKDVKLGRLVQEAKDIPQRKKELDSRLNAHRCSLQNANDELKATMVAVKDTETEIEQINARIRKYREQQFQIKNNDEYRALEQEIAKAKQEIAALEDRELLLMGKVEETKKRLQDIQIGMKADEEHIAEALKKMDERASFLKEQIETVNNERSQFITPVPVDVLGRYDRIMKHVKTGAVVPIENGSCGGCHMNLPPQLVNNAKRNDSLTVCSYCGRIVYRND